MNRRRLLWLAGLVTGLAGCRLPTHRAQEEGTAPGYELLPVIRRDPFYQWQPAGLTQTSEDYSPPGIIDNNGCSLLRRWGHPKATTNPTSTPDAPRPSPPATTRTGTATSSTRSRPGRAGMPCSGSPCRT